MIYQQFVGAVRLDGARDPLAVLRPEDESPQDQKIQRTLQQCDPLALGALG
jgi:hypothetical protein